MYEDDLERNYQLLIEILIALRDTLTMDGLPHVKDLQAVWVKYQWKIISFNLQFVMYVFQIMEIIWKTIPSNYVWSLSGWLPVGDAHAQLA